MQGRTFLQMGDAIGHVNPERGLAHLRKALILIEPAREARLLLLAEHDLAWYLNDLGQPEDPRAALNRASPLCHQAGAFQAYPRPTPPLSANLPSQALCYAVPRSPREE